MIKKTIPFTIKEAEVEGGIYEKINTEFSGNVEIGNYHKDTYGNLDESVLQSPFTEMHVGGNTHRHVPINLGEDNSASRQEAWHLQFNSGGVEFYSYGHLNSPAAFYTREELAKRPLNIKNIKSTDSALGNFKNNYEVIQTSGRRISNNLIVDGYVADGVLTTQFVNEPHVEYFYTQNAILSSSGDGAPISDQLGGSLTISSDGKVIAAGSRFSDNPSGGAGSVVIFKSSPTGWYQDGPPLTSSGDGDPTSDILGYSVSINSDGTILAAGSAYSDIPSSSAGSIIIFKSSSLGWYQDGLPLTSSGDGDPSIDLLGYSVSINSDGTILVAGSVYSDIPSSSAGSIVIFKSSSVGWYQDGPPLTSSGDGDPTGDQFGYSVSINAAGTVVAAGSVNSDSPSNIAGSVIIFKSSSLGWYQDGLPLTSSGDGNPSIDLLGYSVSINSDGTILAAGSTNSDIPSSSAGSIVIFKSSSLGWHQDGLPLTSSGDGNPTSDQLGYSLSINSDGTILVAGSVYSDIPSSSAGSIVIFKSSSVGWYQDGPPLTSSGDGDPTGDQFGYSVAVSSDGKTIVGGSNFGDLPSTSSGILIVFKQESKVTKKSISYALPDLSNNQGKTVIVERFNAPGSKEESSRGALDREGEEMSPNIPLPWRNYKIRQPFYDELSQITPQFGISLHGVNRNTLPGSASRNDESDNGFITRPIPRTDIQYSWITASSITTAGELGGYQSTYYGESDISFISGSEITLGSEKYIIDNLGISSLIKDKKQIDLDTKLLSYSSDIGLSASFGEITRSPYSFATWTSLRTGEHPISRALRKNNIISTQKRLKPEEIKTAKLPYDGVEYNNFRKTKRSATSLNFTEPAVTFKYKPLKTKVRLAGAPEGSEQVIIHTFTNNIGNFANKDLRIETGLEEKERSEQFYDFLKQTYDEAGATGNPIAEFLGYQYSEIVWPREENTGLSKTRKREAYILDQPGFDRDGYDRQLGTQRVFWRDNQEDRKRSKNSEGGYYNSMNYLSTEETGSAFVQLEEGVLSNNKPVLFSSSLAIYPGLDEGIFNSISLIENNLDEKTLYAYTSTISSKYTTSFSEEERIYNSINKKGYTFDVSGEFNHFYNDFYEQINNIEDTNKKSIGSLYRNTSYKSLLTSLPESRNTYEDFSSQIEDEEIFVNPKLKYVSFIGGAELNTGSFVQDENNFTSIEKSIMPYINGIVYSILNVSLGISLLDGIYVGGSFTKVGDMTANRIARWDGTRWHTVGNGFDNTVYSILLHEGSIYAAGSFTTSGSKVSRWDGIEWNSLDSTFVNSEIRVLLSSGSDIYAGGGFTTPQNKIMKWDGFSWSSVGSTISNNTVSALLFSGSDLYAGGDFTSPNPYITFYNGSTWNNVGTGLNNSVYALVLSGSDIYAGGSFTLTGSRVSRWDGSNWNSVGTGLSNNVFTLALSGSDLYAGGSFQTISGSSIVTHKRIAKWDGATWSQVGGGLNNVVQTIVLSGSDVYVGGRFTLTGSKINYWNGADYNKLYNYKEESIIFSQDYFDETFSKQEFLFSTLDNGLLRRTESDSGKKPFFDSYEEFVEDIRGYSKDYSTLAEFKISDHLTYYVRDNNSNFRATNQQFLSLDGQTTHQSSTDRKGLYDESFLSLYTKADKLKKHTYIMKQNSKASLLESIAIKVSGIKKLLPYNGFYPQERTAQLANLYSEFVESNLHGGVYNLSYRNDFFNETVITTSQDTQTLSVAKYENNYYMAIGQPLAKRVLIYRSSDEDPTSWQSLNATIDTPSTYSSDNFGKKVQFISASNGLNLLICGDSTGSADTNGYLFHTNYNGVSWSSPAPLSVHSVYPQVIISGSSPASKFGHYFDAKYTNVEQEEKIIIAIGAYEENTSGKSKNGEVYVVTGTLSNEQWLWSDKELLFTGSANDNNAGAGISIISCSSGYQLYFSETKGDTPVGNIGNIYVITSSDGMNWGNEKIICSGSSINSSIGINNINAIDFDNKTFLFFTEPHADLLGQIDNGAVFVVTSSINNQWPSDYQDNYKKIIYTREIGSDLTPTNYKTNTSLSLFSGSDGRLSYCFTNTSIPEGSGGQIIIGNYSNASGFQDYLNEDYYALDFESNIYSISTVAPYYISEYALPIFFIGEAPPYSSVRAIKNNIFTEFALSVSGSEKFYKHAALEPFMAPGILYNTIKSGIAVDWPCATGSNTAIQPYGANTIVNSYYPKAIEMISYNGSNNFESLYGHLRSNIDYRVPFENIMFPGEAFPAKDFLQEDLISRTVFTTLPDNDSLVEFINGTYIYGGYEPYISPVDFSDVNNIGPKRFSISFVYRKNGSSDTGLCTLAISNFLAETVKFFLKDEKMTTFVSDPDYKWKEFNSDKTYYMDIVLEKSPDLIMMEAYHSDLHPTGSNREKMNGRYFGYPINKTDKEIWGDVDFTPEEKRLIHNDPAYAPYTPPYFEGVARARISFNPQVSGKYSLQEIFDKATVENIFVDIAKGATTGSDAYINAMPINSSIDIFGSAQAVEVTIDETTGQQTVRELQDSQNWIISPRMETPVLDFSSQQLTPYENNYSKTGGFGRGMWSGYGSVPTDGKGIKVRLEDPFATNPSPNTGSLLSQVGLRPEERNVGSVADTKLISEAVVVIPYLDQTTRSKEYSTARKNKTDFEFIKISKKLFNKQLDNYRKGKPAISPGDVNNIIIEHPVQQTSITEMIEKMEKYVIPPEMNFLQYKDIDPFVMYIAEFEHILDQQDLVDIWQGLMPKISYTAEEDSVSITHNSAPYEFFEGKEIPENLRWMVFKVKRKAEYNYFNITATTKDDDRFNFNKIIGRKEGTDIYSYNWPYDFFSLVEFAKVELQLDYKKKEE